MKATGPLPPGGLDGARHGSEPRSDDVKYMLLIYQNTQAWEALPDDERTAVMNEAGELMKQLQESGEWVGGEGLAHPSATKTVKLRGGVPAVTDGPFIEAKEHLAGFLTVDCETEQRAVEIAAHWPDARYWAMEVRPLMGGGGEEM